MTNFLFICSRNQWRSPTAAKVFRQKGYNTRSAGTSPKAKHTLSENDIRWADHIFVMEKKHKNRMIAKFKQRLDYKLISILDIPDEYRFMDQALISHLEDAIAPYL
ncbi:MAG: phosphotyrosine protein phosphatase [Cocleimonas sp.]|nr:phosphotyrosine protein phosphatase [Cocleimonas sp.]